MRKLEEMIAKVSGYMGRMEEESKEQFNFKELTLTQMHYLEMISELQNPNLTELAAAMQLTKPTTVPIATCWPCSSFERYQPIA